MSRRGITRIVRSLRFQLTVTYFAFFGLLLVVIGALFHRSLSSALDEGLRDVLNQEFTGMKGFIRVNDGSASWRYNLRDPEESFLVARMQRVFLLADSDGNVIQVSDAYRSVGVDNPAEIRRVVQSQRPAWRTGINQNGQEYLIRAGVIVGSRDGKQYFIATGRSLSDSRRVVEKFAQSYALLVPLMLGSGLLLGWILAGRALSPVNDVARAAQKLTGSNFGLRLQPRGSGDELDSLIDSFNRMVERLDASFHQIRQFSTDVSHELRTPITAVRGQLEVTLLTKTDPERMREVIADALQDLERLSQLVRALLLLSQAESGQLVLQKSRHDLSKIVPRLIDQFEIPAEDEQVQLVGDLEPDAWVEVDRVQIDRLITNLISNALKFTPESGRIDVRIKKIAESVILTIEDTGSGIPEEHIPHIFDRLYRVPSSASKRGLGLGLSFVKWIVQAHDASIDVKSEVGKGTRFTITFPAVDSAVQDRQSAMPVPASIS